MNMVDGALKYLWLVLLFSEMILNLGSNLEKFEGGNYYGHEGIRENTVGEFNEK